MTEFNLNDEMNRRDAADREAAQAKERTRLLEVQALQLAEQNAHDLLIKQIDALRLLPAYQQLQLEINSDKLRSILFGIHTLASPTFTLVEEQIRLFGVKKVEKTVPIPFEICAEDVYFLPNHSPNDDEITKKLNLPMAGIRLSMIIEGMSMFRDYDSRLSIEFLMSADSQILYTLAGQRDFSVGDSPAYFLDIRIGYSSFEKFTDFLIETTRSYRNSEEKYIQRSFGDAKFTRLPDEVTVYQWEITE